MRTICTTNPLGGLNKILEFEQTKFYTTSYVNQADQQIRDHVSAWLLVERTPPRNMVMRQAKAQQSTLNQLIDFLILYTMPGAYT